MDNGFIGTGAPALLRGFDGGFLRLRPEKAPYSWDVYSVRELRGAPDVGLIVPEPFVVVDIDDAVQADKLTRLVTEEGIKCQIMQTTRGRHFWFAAEEPMKNTVASCTGIGLVADYRSWGKMSQVCVKFRGEWRQWLTAWDWGDIDELPRWLRPLRQNRWRFYDMGEGDGRNQALFEYQIELSKRGYTQREGKEVLRLINQYVFNEPLENGEFGTVSREEAYPDTETPVTDYDTPWFDGKKFLHNVMGDMLAAEVHIVSMHGQLYAYKDGCYRPGENVILRHMVDRFPECSKRHQSEVLNYLSIRYHIEEPVLDEYIINVTNGRLDVRTGELLPHTPDAYDFQQIPVAYDSTVYHEPLDHMLTRVFCGDYRLYKLFEEMVGYCLIRNCRMQVLFVLFGDGNNGKSTLLRVLSAFLGKENYSTLSLQDLETTFRPAELLNRLANLGDDIPYTDIQDSSKLKSLTTGEGVTVERKNQHPFTLYNYAKLIFTTNRMPRVRDKSEGFWRRLKLLPLDATFAKTDPDYDPDISAKVVSPEALTYLLNMGIRGARRLLKRGFTHSAKVDKAIDTYKVESSTTLTWVRDEEITADYLKSKPTSELYYEFSTWCGVQKIKNAPEHQTFSKDICRYLKLRTELRQVQGGTKRQRYFVDDGA